MEYKKQSSYSWKQFGKDIGWVLLAFLPWFLSGALPDNFRTSVTGFILIYIVMNFAIFIFLLKIKLPSRAALIYSILQLNIIMIIWWFVQHKKDPQIYESKVKSNKTKKDVIKKESKGMPLVLSIVIIILSLIIAKGCINYDTPYEYETNYLNEYEPVNINPVNLTQSSDFPDASLIETKQINLTECGLTFNQTNLWESDADYLSEDVLVASYYDNYNLLLRVDISRLDYNLTMSDYIFNMQRGGLDDIKDLDYISNMTAGTDFINSIEYYGMSYIETHDDSVAEINQMIFINNNNYCSFVFMADEGKMNEYEEEINNVKKTISLI